MTQTMYKDEEQYRGGNQTMLQAMILKVFKYGNREFLNGYSLEFLGREDLMGGDEEQYYEFYEDEIPAMVNEFNASQNDFELETEEFQLQKEDLVHVFVKQLSDMNYDELLRYYKFVMRCDDTEAIAMASMWDEINKNARAESTEQSSR